MEKLNFEELLKQSLHELENGPITIHAHMKNGDVIEYRVDSRNPEAEQKAFEKAYEDFYGIEGADPQ